MGKKSELSVSPRLEIVLMILRKEEPISVLARLHGTTWGRAIDIEHEVCSTTFATLSSFRRSLPWFG